MLALAPEAHYFLATRSEIAFHLGKRSLIFNELRSTSLAVAQTARDLAIGLCRSATIYGRRYSTRDLMRRCFGRLWVHIRLRLIAGSLFPSARLGMTSKRLAQQGGYRAKFLSTASRARLFFRYWRARLPPRVVEREPRGPAISTSVSAAVSPSTAQSDHFSAATARKEKMTMSCTMWMKKAHAEPRVSIMLRAQIHPANPAITTPIGPEGCP